jgi:hypothetical protein
LLVIRMHSLHTLSLALLEEIDKLWSVEKVEKARLFNYNSIDELLSQ